jgi:hypothetical protein
MPAIVPTFAEHDVLGSFPRSVLIATDAAEEDSRRAAVKDCVRAVALLLIHG